MGARTEGSTYEFYNLVPSLVERPSEAFAQGFGTFVPYLILMVVFAGATFLPMVLQQMNNKDNAQRKQMVIMSAVMSVFMLWISWSSPAGVLLFWGASSLIGLGQQQISMRIMKKRDAEAAETIEVKPIEVDVTRKVQEASSDEEALGLAPIVSRETMRFGGSVSPASFGLPIEGVCHG